uniref:CENP-V/GFA domain-containing protein n=1 Tax=Plectus sambesii TaxID=2011161 RepID=A0A914V6R3_9BILA
MTIKLTGGCHCGAIRYDIDAAQFKRILYCHCRICQHTAGAPAVPFLTVLVATEFRYTKGTPAIYHSSNHAERRFCSLCSTQLDFRDNNRPDDVDILTITLDNPNEAPPSMHVFCESLVSWYHIEDGLPCYNGCYKEEEQNKEASS